MWIGPAHNRPQTNTKPTHKPTHQTQSTLIFILSLTQIKGLVVASDYKKGQRLVADREFADNAEFFRDAFEVGRRYKVMNPEKMRGTYGKLVYM